MTISNSKLHLFSVILKAFFLLLLLNKVKSRSDSLHFNYNNFSSEVKNIIFQGDAKLTRAALQLGKTDENEKPLSWSAGRALYSEPVHLWDHDTGRVASFYTSFKVLLKSSERDPADGFAFFLSPVDSDVKRPGEFLGLFADTIIRSSKEQVVAVEFDTWVNADYFSDPPYRHIGIDVNAIESVATKKWEDSDVFSGKIATAHISFDPSSRILTVVLSYPDGGDYTLARVVDLSANLPEWVRVGFSASTGGFSERHHVLYWHFSSAL